MSAEGELYEAMYILSSDVEEDEMKQIADSLGTIAMEVGAVVKADEMFGRRRFAYEIDRRRDGIYRVMYFRGTGAAVAALKNEFQLNERIIRGIVVVANPQAIVRPPPERPRAAEVATEAPVSAAEETAPEAEAAAVAAEETAPETETEQPPAAVEPEAAPEPAEPETGE